MTRGAKIVIFSVVGLFLLAGIYYGFLAPTANHVTDTTTTDPIASGDGLSGDTASLTLTPNSALPADGTNGMPPVTPVPPAFNDTIGMNAGAFAPPTTPVGTVKTVPTPNSPDPLTWNKGIATPTVPMGPVIAPPSAVPMMAEPTPVKIATTPKAASANENYTAYTVKSGDTLSGIAGEWFHDVNNWPAIVKANPGLNPSSLRVGQKINLPSKTATRTASSTTTKAPAAAKASASGNEHVVVKGETLASISDKVYGNRTSWKRIYDANKGVIGGNPSALKVGMKLSIPSKS